MFLYNGRASALQFDGVHVKILFMIMDNSIDSECESCRTSLRPWNAATNFSKPAYSVAYATATNMISSGQHVLEFGGGNLRNIMYLMSKVPTAEYHVIEKTEVVNRFGREYEGFERRGGRLVRDGLDTCQFDIVICTFVLETICPSQHRTEVLLSLRKALRNDGAFIASFRGYPGVKGTRYKQCPAGEGFITPLRTFIRPYSIAEVQDLLRATGFVGFDALQKYKVETPQNIHIKAGV